MSLFVPMSLTCPECAEVFTYESVGSINAERRSDLRDKILQGELQTVQCDACAHETRLEPNFNYLDLGRGQWIAALPLRNLRDHLEIAADKQAVFDLSYGPQASAAAQRLGQGVQQRLVFGWSALREKLVLQEIGLDDVLWEVAKLDLCRMRSQAEGVDLRLLGLRQDMLELAWIRADSEEHLSEFQVSRALYDDIAAAPARWAAVQALLRATMFVDIQKLFVGEAETSA